MLAAILALSSIVLSICIACFAPVIVQHELPLAARHRYYKWCSYAIVLSWVLTFVAAATLYFSHYDEYAATAVIMAFLSDLTILIGLGFFLPRGDK